MLEPLDPGSHMMEISDDIDIPDDDRGPITAELYPGLLHQTRPLEVATARAVQHLAPQGHGHVVSAR